MVKKVLLIGANGYVGSALKYYLSGMNFDVVGVDNFLRPCHPKIDGLVQTSYQNLSLSFLDQFEVCLWFAGHASVTQCVDDQSAACANNLYDLVLFRNKFRGRLIYASSASVYSGNNGLSSEVSPTTPPSNVYDYTKVTFDNYLNAIEDSNYIGLRMGTVSGLIDPVKDSVPNHPTARLRWELIINAMVSNAIVKGEINLSNEESLRSILSINDLAKSILNLLLDPPSSGIYNLFSFNSKIGEIAAAISERTGAKIVRPESSSKTYSFQMSRKKLDNCYPNSKFETLDNLIDTVSNAIDQAHRT